MVAYWLPYILDFSPNGLSLRPRQGHVLCSALGPFSSPEPLVPLSRQSLGHEEQVALGTLDFIDKSFNEGNLNLANAGLQITVGNRTLADQILLMSDKI